MPTLSIRTVLQLCPCWCFIHLVGLSWAPQLRRNKYFQLHVDPFLCNLSIWYVAYSHRIPTLTTCTAWFRRININHWLVKFLHRDHSTLKNLTLHKYSLIESIGHLQITKFTTPIDQPQPCVATVDLCIHYHFSRFEISTLSVLVEIVELTTTTDLSLPLSQPSDPFSV